MEPTSAKKIISLQLELAEKSKDLFFFKEKLALMKTENDKLKTENSVLQLEIEKLKIAKTETIIEEIVTEELTIEEQDKTYKKKRDKNGL